jgi:hypothetical protein
MHSTPHTCCCAAEKEGVTHLGREQLLHVFLVKHGASNIIEHLAGLVWGDVLGLWERVLVAE